MVAAVARGRKSKCVTPPKGRKAGETHGKKKESEDWTRRKISQNGAREKLPPPGESAVKNKRRNFKKCTFPPLHQIRNGTQYSGGNFEVIEISLHEEQTIIAPPRDCLFRKSMLPDSNNIPPIPSHHRRRPVAFSAHSDREGGSEERRNYKNH